MQLLKIYTVLSEITHLQTFQKCILLRQTVEAFLTPKMINDYIHIYITNKIQLKK